MAKDSDEDKAPPSPRSPHLKPNNDRIAEALKRAYDDVAQAPLPDRLARLMQRLKDEGDP